MLRSWKINSISSNFYCIHCFLKVHLFIVCFLRYWNVKQISTSGNNFQCSLCLVSSKIRNVLQEFNEKKWNGSDSRKIFYDCFHSKLNPNIKKYYIIFNCDKCLAQIFSDVNDLLQSKYFNHFQWTPIFMILQFFFYKKYFIQIHQWQCKRISNIFDPSTKMKSLGKI